MLTEYTDHLSWYICSADKTSKTGLIFKYLFHPQTSTKYFNIPEHYFSTFSTLDFEINKNKNGEVRRHQLIGLISLVSQLPTAINK